MPRSGPQATHVGATRGQRVFPEASAGVTSEATRNQRGCLESGILICMGMAEIGVVVIFIIAVALAVWWVVVSLRR